MNKFLRIISMCLFTTIFVVPFFTSAQNRVEDYQLLTPLPVGENGEVVPVIEFSKSEHAFADFINDFIALIIAIAGVLAVIMIVIGGIKYITSESGGGKGTAKEYITGAIGGLILILGSYLLLQTINPELVNIRGVERIDFAVATEPTEPGWYYKQVENGLFDGPFPSLEEIIKDPSKSTQGKQLCEEARTEFINKSTAEGKSSLTSPCIEIKLQGDRFCYFYKGTNWIGADMRYDRPDCYDRAESCYVGQEEARVENKLVAECQLYHDVNPDKPISCFYYPKGNETIPACFPREETCTTAFETVKGKYSNEITPLPQGCSTSPLTAPDGSPVGDRSNNGARWCYTEISKETNKKSEVCSYMAGNLMLFNTKAECEEKASLPKSSGFELFDPNPSQPGYCYRYPYTADILQIFSDKRGSDDIPKTGEFRNSSGSIVSAYQITREQPPLESSDGGETLKWTTSELGSYIEIPVSEIIEHEGRDLYFNFFPVDKPVSIEVTAHINTPQTSQGSEWKLLGSQTGTAGSWHVIITPLSLIPDNKSITKLRFKMLEPNSAPTTQTRYCYFYDNGSYDDIKCESSMEACNASFNTVSEKDRIVQCREYTNHPDIRPFCLDYNRANTGGLVNNTVCYPTMEACSEATSNIERTITRQCYNKEDTQNPSQETYNNIIFFDDIYVTTRQSSSDYTNPYNPTNPVGRNAEEQFQQLVLGENNSKEMRVRQILKAMKIGVKSSVDRGSDPLATTFCPSTSRRSGCTNVGGLSNDALEKIQLVKTRCDLWPGKNSEYINSDGTTATCNIIITGGTEWWFHGNKEINLTGSGSRNTTHHIPEGIQAYDASGPYGGKTVDISYHDKKLNKFITESEHFTRCGTSRHSTSWPLWCMKNEDGTVNRDILFRYETSPIHWHAEFGNGFLRL